MSAFDIMKLINSFPSSAMQTVKKLDEVNVAANKVSKSVNEAFDSKNIKSVTGNIDKTAKAVKKVGYSAKEASREFEGIFRLKAGLGLSIAAVAIPLAFTPTPLAPLAGAVAAVAGTTGVAFGGVALGSHMITKSLSDMSAITPAITDLESKLKRLQAVYKHTKKHSPSTDLSGMNKEEQELHALIKNYKRLKDAKTELSKVRVSGSSQDVEKYRKRVTQLSNEINKMNKQGVGKAFMRGGDKTIDVIDNLRKKLIELKKARNQAFTVDQINQYNKAIKDVEDRLKGVKKHYPNKGMTDDEVAAKKAAAKTQFQGAANKGFDFVKSSVLEAAKLSDKYEAVKRETGLTKKELKGITDLSKHLSRTSTSDLLDFATLGGQLGVANKDIVGFTKSVDKAQVVLGSSFGGDTKGMVTRLMLIKDQFEQTKNIKPESALLGITSALHALDKKGKNTADGVSSFVAEMKLMKGVKLELPQSMALGAVLGDAGVAVQTAGSSVRQLFALLGQNKAASGLEKLLGIPLAQVKELQKSNPAKLFTDMASKLKGMSTKEITDILSGLGLKKVTSKNAQDMVSVLAKLAGKTKAYTNYTRLAAKELSNANAVTNAFRASNNTLGGEMAIASNAFSQMKITVGEMLAPAVAWLATQFLHLANFIQSHWSVIGPILLSVGFAVGLLSLKMIQLQIAALPTVLPIMTLAVGIGMLIAAFQTSSPLLFIAAGAFLLLTHRTWGQVLSLKVFSSTQKVAALQSRSFANILNTVNNVMRNNPVLIFITVLTTLVSIVSLLYNKFEVFRTIIDSFGRVFKMVFGGIFSLFSSFFSNLGGSIDATSDKLDSFASKQAKIAKTNKKYFEPLLYRMQVGKTADDVMKGFRDNKHGKRYTYGSIDYDHSKKWGLGVEKTTDSKFLHKNLIKYSHLMDSFIKEGVPLKKMYKKDGYIKQANTDEMVKQGFERVQTKKGIMDVSVELLNKSPTRLFDETAYKPLLEKYRKYNKGVIAESKKRKKLGITDLNNPTSTAKSSLDHFGKDSKNLKGGLQQVSASGVKEKNYYINFESFVKGGFNVHSTDTKTTAQATYDEFLKMFMRVVNNAQTT